MIHKTLLFLLLLAFIPIRAQDDIPTIAAMHYVSDVSVVYIANGVTEQVFDEFSVAIPGSPQWSPDGSFFMFTTYETHNINRITQITVDDVTVTPLGSVSWLPPGYSPDMSQVAYAGPFDASIVVKDVDDENRIELPLERAEHKSIFNVQWSPDGEWILFTTEGKLMRMRTDGTELEVILPETRRAREAVYSPDGEWIAFTGASEGDMPDIYVMRGDGSELARLTTHSAADTQPAWSPDSERLVFLSTRNSQPGYVPQRDLYTINRDGSDLAQLTDAQVDEIRPQWVGNWIGYLEIADIPNTGCNGVQLCGGYLKLIHPDGTGLTPIAEDLVFTSFAIAPN